MNNRLANAKNPFQGDMKKVLCVCSAGLLRSPTIAWILSNPPFNYNTRACGTSIEFALVPLDAVLTFWADEVVVVEPWMAGKVKGIDPKKIVHIVDTPDMYETRDSDLITYLTPKLKEVFNVN